MADRLACVDTNTFVSSVLARSSKPAQAIELLLDAYVIVQSDETAAELIDVVGRAYFDRWMPRSFRLTLADHFLSACRFVAPTATIQACVDPKDDKFLSLAVSASAQLIVTGDDHLLRLHPFHGIQVLKPAAFLEWHSQQNHPQR